MSEPLTIDLGNCRYMQRPLGWRAVALDDNGSPVGPEHGGDDTLLEEVVRLRTTVATLEADTHTRQKAMRVAVANELALQDQTDALRAERDRLREQLDNHIELDGPDEPQ